MIETFKKLLIVLTSEERKQAIFLIIMMLIVALLDTLGVASIMPFMAVLTNPDVIETNFLIKKSYIIAQDFGIKNSQQFLFFLGLLVFLILIFSLAIKALNTYLLSRFVMMREYSIGKRLVEGYLHQPYSWFLDRHSADLGKTILSEAQNVSRQIIKPIMDLIAFSTVVIALLTLLILVDPNLALISGLTISIVYVLIYWISRNFLNKIGKERLKANQSRFTIISEAFGATKEIKLGNLENTYVQRFKNPALIFAKHQASSQLIILLPRYALEAIAFGGLLLITLYLMVQTGNFSNVVPIISLYTLAGYRILPAMQQIYGNMSLIRFGGPTLDAMHRDFMNLKSNNINNINHLLSHNNNIHLNKVYYRYPNSKENTLKGIDIKIPSRSTVGFVGTTGSGKTTTVDLILGLLEAQKGTLEVDGLIINNENRKTWQSSIGYVPQRIFLSDDTVSSNIAFGISPENINLKSVKKAAQIANLHEFVMKELPLKYDTAIGENGVRLSGGQRQRIGIARALYHNPDILILDEATSALDNLTEQAVMEAVNKLSHEITIILIAHRLSTVKKCDIIFLLKNGKLMGQGSFDELKKTNKFFRTIADAN